MPDDITNATTAWQAVTPSQNEVWQCVLGKVRISFDTSPALGAMSLENGILLDPKMTINVTSGQPVRYRKASAARATIARALR